MTILNLLRQAITGDADISTSVAELLTSLWIAAQ